MALGNLTLDHRMGPLPHVFAHSFSHDLLSTCLSNCQVSKLPIRTMNQTKSNNQGSIHSLALSRQGAMKKDLALQPLFSPGIITR